MKPTTLVAITLLASVCAAGALAVEPLTRAQVRAETLAAQRAGEIPFGDLAIKPDERNPELYPGMPKQTPLTRAEVRAETRQAIRDGDIPVDDDGQTERELEAPPAKPAPGVGLTRAEVRAETARAARDGDLQVGDSGRTQAEIDPQRYAAARARDLQASAAPSARTQDSRPPQ